MERSLESLSVAELIEHIGSRDIAPGAGAAGAVTLALGAACAAKAVAISLKDAPEDHPLQQALARLERLGRLSLRSAQADAQAFSEFVHTKSADAAQELVGVADRIGALIGALLRCLDEIEGRVKPRMQGDVLAARALAHAASVIQKANQAEAIKAQA